MFLIKKPWMIICIIAGIIYISCKKSDSISNDPPSETDGLVIYPQGELLETAVHKSIATSACHQYCTTWSRIRFQAATRAGTFAKPVIIELNYTEAIAERSRSR